MTPSGIERSTFRLVLLFIHLLISAIVTSRKESTIKFKFMKGFVEDVHVSFTRIKYWKEKD